MGTLTPEQHSERMSRIRGRDTKPELLIRKATGIGAHRPRARDRSATPWG